MKKSKGKKLIGAGIISAIAASLCCITPVLALFAGVGGVASTFSWIEPFRPYLMWITILVLVYAWHQKLKPVKNTEIACACEDKKTSFWQSKKFLGFVAVFALFMLAFPHFSYIFYPKKNMVISQNKSSNITQSTYQVEGMTCESCNYHIEHEISLLPGYMYAKADYKIGMVDVKYDKTKLSDEEVEEAINKAGYKIISNN